MVAEGLVDEALTPAVEHQRVLRVVERLVGELHRVVQRYVGEHEVAVESGVVLPEGGARLPREPEACARAHRVRPQRHQRPIRVDQRRYQVAIALVAAGGEQRRRRVDATLGAVSNPQEQALHRALVHHEFLDRRAPHDLAPSVADDLLASTDVGGRVDRPATAVAEDRHFLPDGDAQRAHPFDRLGEPGDQRVAQRRVASGIDLREHLVRRRGPEISGVAGRPAELGGALHEQDGRTVASQRVLRP